jgi:NADPH-dependent 2,4-dienoyl-CoA reductase/sulfur reductase-like enzyme
MTLFGPRRRFLGAAAALGAAVAARAAPLVAATAPQLLPPPSKAGRAVVVGGGWGGLSAARQLRERVPALEVVLLERNAAFWSCPLSTRWLAGLVDPRLLIHDYAAAASAYGYRVLRAEVQAVERDRRRVITDLGTVDYDWLILAPGIRHDYGAWFGGERRAIDHARTRFPSAYTAGEEFPLLKQKLERFAGGDLLMTLPPMPYRCPPAPYERAMLIAWLIKSRGIKGRLFVLDPNPSTQAVTDRHKGATDDRRNGATWSGSKWAFRTVRRMG